MIAHETNILYKKQAGEAKVVEDKSISKVTVNIDIKFNQEELQDIFWIDQKEDANHYTLVIKVNSSSFTEMHSILTKF